MSTIFLVHGAWGSSWSWVRLKPALEKLGHRVIASDLPGHGTNTGKPIDQVTLDDYVDCVVADLEKLDEPATVLGHSLGGTIISQAAEKCPGKVKQLVYMSAFLLVNGEKQMDRIVSDKFTKVVVGETLFVHENGTCDLNKELVRKVFFNTTSDEDAAFALEHLQTDTLVPMQQPLVLTPENYGKIPRVYIHCLQDNGITITTQRDMVAKSPCVQEFDMDCDHFAFSKGDELVKILDSIM